MARRFFLSLALWAFLCSTVLAVPTPEFVPEKTLADNWYSIFMDGTRVGYTQERVERGKLGEKTLIRAHVEEAFSFTRMGTQLSIEFDGDSFETTEGRLHSFTAAMKMGPLGVTRIKGHTDAAGLLHYTVETMGQPFSKTMELESGVFAFWKNRQKEKNHFAQKTKEFTLTSFSTQDQQVITTSYKMLGKETRILNGVSRELTKIELRLSQFPDIPMYQWIDDKGDIQIISATLMPGLAFEFQKTTRVLALSSPEKKELFINTLITPDKPIQDPNRISSIEYRLAFRGNKVPDFPNNQRQSFKSLPNRMGHLSIRHSRTLDVDGPTGIPEAVYLAATPFAQSGDPRIQKAAQEAVHQLKTPREKAARLTQWVYKHVEDKNLGIGFASASEVFANPEGDCTEHSVLLVAMLRAVGIPARATVGVVYSPALKAFGYHMWTEAYVDGGWIGLDATMNETRLNPTHIKFLDTPLEQMGGGDLAGVIQYMQGMDIRIVKIKE